MRIMRIAVFGTLLLAALALASAGCGSKGVELDTKSTLRYDSVRDGVPELSGPGAAPPGGKVSKKDFMKGASPK
jgi:hypothetical protein